jgi:5-formyltetrahydrofolate cyclo-ligase
MSSISEKNAIRSDIRARREALWQEAARADAASTAICDRLLFLDEIAKANSWFIYASAGGEVATLDLIKVLLERGSTVALPLVTGPGTMIARQIKSLAELRANNCGILAPPPGDPISTAIDVCICPGIAFSEEGDRLGTGKGYYDRFLASHHCGLVVGLAFDRQIVPQLPREPHDRQMDLVVTETRVIRRQ